MTASETQATQAAHIKDALVADLKDILTTLTEKQMEVQSRHTEMVLQAQAEHSGRMSADVGKAIADHLGGPIADIASAVKGVSANQGDAVNKMLTDVLAGFSAQMQDMFGGQMRGMTDLLKEWLDSRLPSVVRDSVRTPGWLSTLVANRNLLRDDPCAKYGAKLLAGDGSEFHAAIAGLGIPSDSWVPEEAVVAQMRAGAALGHDRFRDTLPDLLSVATGKAGLVPSRSLQTRCVALLVSRYAKITGQPEHMALRDAAVGVIGKDRVAGRGSGGMCDMAARLPKHSPVRQ